MEPITQFSPCKLYRYTLWRQWCDDKSPLRYVQFVGLNPSTADATNDDPTIRRCIGFAKSWGYGGLCMTNLFAFRATKPEDMLAHHAPIGQDNDMWICRIAIGADLIVACWGNDGAHLGRDTAVLQLLSGFAAKSHCFGRTKTGSPWHPLYLKKTLQPIKLP